MKRILFTIFRGFNYILCRLPLSFSMALSKFLYLIIYYLAGYRKKVVRTNLKNAFPEKSKTERTAIEKKFFHHLCDTILETIILHNISEKKINQRCVYKNPEVLDEIYKSGKSMIGVVGHYGNWEYLNGLQLVTDFQVLGLYKPLHNKYFDKFLYEIRQNFGMIPVPVKTTLKSLFKFKKENVQTLMIIVGDQTPPKHEIQYWTKFLNQDTPLYLGVEKIAKKMDQVVVFIRIDKIKSGYYEVSFIKLFDDPANTEEYEISDAHLRTLESIIKEKPEFWLWSHRRWKHKKTASEQITNS